MTTIDFVNQSVAPIAAFGTAGSGYCVLSAPGVSSITRSVWDFHFHADAYGQAADLDMNCEVAAHIFASTVTGAPASAAVVATWAGTNADLLADRTALAGYTYLRSIPVLMRANGINIIQPATGASFEQQISFYGQAGINIPGLSSMTGIKRIVVVLVSRDYVNSAINQPVSVDASVQTSG